MELRECLVGKEPCRGNQRLEGRLRHSMLVLALPDSICDYPNVSAEVLQIEILHEGVLDIGGVLDLEEFLWHITIIEPDYIDRLCSPHQVII